MCNKGASIYHVVRGGWRGVYEMTMNDHEGEGRVSEMTTWSGGSKFYCFRSGNGYMNSPFEQHSYIPDFRDVDIHGAQFKIGKFSKYC